MKLIIGPHDSMTASIATVDQVKRGIARIVGSEWQVFDANTGKSVDDPLPGFTSRIVELEE